MDYSIRDHTLYLADDGTTSLSSFKLKDTELLSRGQLLKLMGNTITAMALDWVTLNVYWSSSKQPRLQVTAKAYTAVLIKDGIGRIESIALHPPSGRLCFANLGLQDTNTIASVECANMDGTGRGVLRKEAVEPTSLSFSRDGETIYWADIGRSYFWAFVHLHSKYSLKSWLFCRFRQHCCCSVGWIWLQRAEGWWWTGCCGSDWWPVVLDDCRR